MNPTGIDHEQLIESLLAAMNQAVRGDYAAAQQALEAATKTDSALLRRFAETLELISVKIEAREYALQQANESLGGKKDTRFQVALFDSPPYLETALRTANESHNFALHFFTERLKPNTVALATGCQAVCVPPTQAVSAALAKALTLLGVRLIALSGVGYENVDLDACQAQGISVVRVPAYSPQAVAEHAVALMMCLNRKIHRAHQRVQESNFSLNGLIGFTMHGRTAGIIGAGRIGVCTLEILHGYGCRLLAYSRTPKPELSARLGVEFVSLQRLLAEADIISLHAPLTPETRHLIDAAAIRQLKRGAMIINTSRGALIDTAALLEGLKSGQVGFAGLDVYEAESDYFFVDWSDRVVTDDALARLTTFGNVIVTPHQGFLTTEALTSIADTTLSSIAEFQSGRQGAALTHAVLPANGKADSPATGQAR